LALIRFLSWPAGDVEAFAIFSAIPSYAGLRLQRRPDIAKISVSSLLAIGYQSLLAAALDGDLKETPIRDKNLDYRFIFDGIL